MRPPRVHDEGEPEFFSVLEAAELAGRPPGMIRRWVFRGQLACLWLDDGSIQIPRAALTARLSVPPRVERLRRGG